MSFLILAETLDESLPEILWRSRWDYYQDMYGLPFAKGTMANLDCDGRGPIHGRAGGRIYYLKSDYLNWLCDLDEIKID